MANINVIEEFMPKEYQDLLECVLLTDGALPYSFNKSTTYNQSDYKDKNTKDAPQFIHAFMNNGIICSQKWDVVSPLPYYFMAKTRTNLKLARIKANITMPLSCFSEGEYYPPHKDFSQNGGITAIYYVNDADGDTLFFEEPETPKIDGAFKEIFRLTPKKGTLIYFDNSVLHCGEPPKTSEIRALLNINFLPQECFA
jgi:hypothetical protein